MGTTQTITLTFRDKICLRYYRNIWNKFSDQCLQNVTSIYTKQAERKKVRKKPQLPNESDVFNSLIL